MKSLSGFISALVYAFLFGPMIVLVVLSFNVAKSGSQWEGFTWRWYLKLFENDSIQGALFNSLQIAVAAMFLSAFLGTALALAQERSGFGSRKILKKVSNLPILFPDIVIALSLLAFFDLIFLPLGKLTVVIAHSSFGAAYVASLVRARIKSMDPLLEDAASDLGGSAWKVFTLVTFPQLRPAIISGMLMVFTLSFDDFIISFFTAGVDSATLPMKIYSMLKFGVTPEVNALSALILCTSILLVSLGFWTQQRSKMKISR